MDGKRNAGMVPLGTGDFTQIDIWNSMKSEGAVNPFEECVEDDEHKRLLARHKLWLQSFRHECPSPYTPYRIGVYIRYFNQTKYPDYLTYHKKQFADTIALCPNWRLVDFYVDEGQSAPQMANAKGWMRCLDDCMHGRIDLIVTQKISNVSRDYSELIFCSRMLATLKPPVGPIGIYFISEDLFTLASYYQDDMHDTSILPEDSPDLLPGEIGDLTVDSWERLDEQQIQQDRTE